LLIPTRRRQDMTDQPAEAEQPAGERKQFQVTTTAQVERTYLVEADDEDHAKKRLRSFIADADALRPGLIEEIRSEDSTAQRITGAVTRHKPEGPARLKAAS
jgi:hypothetical protein